MLRGLTRHTNCLSHLSVDRSLARSGTIMLTLLNVGPVTLLVGLARGLFLLLLCLPLFTNLFKFCVVVKLVSYTRCIKRLPR